MRIYLDVCCLNRPFDDQKQERIRLEAEAVLLILERCQKGQWELVGSEAIWFEITQIPDEERRQKVLALAKLKKEMVVINQEIVNRAIFLEKNSVPAMDAIHLACAESAEVDVFLTTDDLLLKKAKRIGKILKVRVANPVHWLMEVLGSEKNNDDASRDKTRGD